MFNLSKKPQNTDHFSSKLYDEKSFYGQFIRDLMNSKSEVIIESPFITTNRMKYLAPVFDDLINRGVKVYVITRDPKEHSPEYEQQSESAIQNFEVTGVQTIICGGNHHRKLAVIDQNVLWEGSLNILSQTKSREIMRRIESKTYATEMYNFLKYSKIR